ncbi:unnamed protein product [Alopecurus aequalis]
MKRKYRQPAEDRLSALPDDMLHCILSHLTSDQAVRTSLLSRRWRDVYEAIPVVDLVGHKKGSPWNYSDNVKVCFDQKVTGAILCKAPGTPIRTLRLDAFHLPQELLDQWILSAVSSGADEIDVILRYGHSHGCSLCPFGSSQEYFYNNLEGRYVKTHHQLFGCPTLRWLRLTSHGCSLCPFGSSQEYFYNNLEGRYVKTHHQLFGCPTLRWLRLTSWKLDLPLGVLMASLETLHLERIMDPNGLLQQLLANCPRLADLMLQECPNLTAITVTSTHLRSFSMICCHHAQQVNLHSQCLKSLHYKGSLLPRNSLFELANHAGVVALSIEICQDLTPTGFDPLGLQGCLRDEDDVRSVVDFLYDTPNLEVLSLFPLGPRAPKKREYFYDSESDDELEGGGVDYSGQVTDGFWQLTHSFWPVHIRSLDDKLRRINIGRYKGLQLQRILVKFLLSRSASLEEFSVTLAAGCSRRKHIRELRSWRSNTHTRVAVSIQQ